MPESQERIATRLTNFPLRFASLVVAPPPGMAPHPAGSHLLAREIHGEGALQKVRIAADGMGGVAVVAAAVEEWSNNVWHNVCSGVSCMIKQQKW